MRGRKPKPDVLHALHGSREPRAKPPVQPPGELVEPPGHFADDQRGAWAYAIANAPPGLLKRIDISALEVWVVAHCLHRRAAAQQNQAPLIVNHPVPNLPDGKPGPQTQIPVQSPLIPIINRQALVMLKAAEQLGFTPASRPRVYGVGMQPTGGGLGAGSAATAGAQDGQESVAQYLARRPTTAKTVH